jgi:hypothetical protein
VEEIDVCTALESLISWIIYSILYKINEKARALTAKRGLQEMEKL